VRCFENLGNFPRALTAYREALVGTTDPSERADIQRRIEAILRRPVRIFVTSDPPGATVLVDAREEPEAAIPCAGGACRFLDPGRGGVM